jgi:hypothetical protein
VHRGGLLRMHAAYMCAYQHYEAELTARKSTLDVHTGQYTTAVQLAPTSSRSSSSTSVVPAVQARHTH